MRTIMPAFDRFAEEGKIIGRLVTGYGELEFDLATCVSEVIADFDTAFKVIYRAGSEALRINVGDAMARHKVPTQKLRTKFEQAVAGMNACRKIRNQYAHCSFGDEHQVGLWFVNPEEVAEQNVVFSLGQLEQRFVNVALLRDQEAHFTWVSDCFNFISHEMRVRSGASKTNPFAPAPRSRPKPKMYNLSP